MSDAMMEEEADERPTKIANLQVFLYVALAFWANFMIAVYIQFKITHPDFFDTLGYASL